MSAMRTPIFIVDANGTPVEAQLCAPIGSDHVDDTENKWNPWQTAALASQANPREESAHWNWRWKVQNYGGQLGFPSYAIECAGETQGLMLLNTLESCRLPQRQGKSMVYIEYLVTAPWNRLSLAPQPRFGGIGSALVGVAIQISFDEGFDGRLGLHSLPQASAWYAQKCGMTDLGIDPNKKPLQYFEITTDQANAFLAKGA